MTRHFHTLDAMRGIAAIAVVCMHAQAHQLIHGVSFRKSYLAVDFFFMLSGLVIAQAYGARLEGQMSFRRFFLLRLVRLYPLYLLGTAIGLVLVAIAILFGNMRQDPVSLTGAVTAALLMLPNPFAIETHGWLMPFNVAGWSLIFELAVNLLYAGIVRWLNRPVLVAIIALSGLALGVQTLAHGNTDVGAEWASAPLGIARTLFGFFLGVLIARSMPAEHRRTPLALLLPLPLLAAFMLGEGQGALYDLACVLLLFPLLLIVGARIEPTRAGPFAFLGLISFAIYAVHGPILTWIDVPVRRIGMPVVQASPWMGPAIVGGLVLFAWAADRFYDRPVRARLGRRLNTPRSAAA